MTMEQTHGLDELCGQGRMTWVEKEKGCLAVPEDVVSALSKVRVNS